MARKYTKIEKANKGKIFYNDSFVYILAECTQRCWDRKKISCFSPAPSSYLLQMTPMLIQWPHNQIHNQILFFTALAPTHFFPCHEALSSPFIQLNQLGSVVQTVWDRFKHDSSWWRHHAECRPSVVSIEKNIDSSWWCHQLVGRLVSHSVIRSFDRTVRSFSFYLYRYILILKKK